jgi:hypothetical protein
VYYKEDQKRRDIGRKIYGDQEVRRRRGSWRSLLATATTRYGCLITIQCVEAGGTLQTYAKGHICRNSFKIMEWYSNLYYGMEIFCTKINGIEIFHPIINERSQTHQTGFRSDSSIRISHENITTKPSISNSNDANSVISNMATLPKTYKAACFQKANDPLTIIDVELKLPAAGEVLVKVIAVGKAYIISTPRISQA